MSSPKRVYMVLLHEGLAALEYFGERLSDILRDHEIPVEIVKGRPNGDAKARKLYYVLFHETIGQAILELWLDSDEMQRIKPSLEKLAPLVLFKSESQSGLVNCGMPKPPEFASPDAQAVNRIRSLTLEQSRGSQLEKRIMYMEVRNPGDEAAEQFRQTLLNILNRVGITVDLERSWTPEKAKVNTLYWPPTHPTMGRGIFELCLPTKAYSILKPIIDKQPLLAFVSESYDGYIKFSNYVPRTDPDELAEVDL